MQKLIIIVKGRQAKAFPMLIEEITTAVQDNWMPIKESNECRMFGAGHFQVVFEKEGEDKVLIRANGVLVAEYEKPLEAITETLDVNPNESLLLEFEALTKKQGMLEWALKNGIEVPADRKYPTQIKSYVESQLKLK